MCCVWGMAQSVNTKIRANRQRGEGCWLALLCCCLACGSLCSGHSPGQRVTCGGFWRRRRKGKARADSAVQLMPVPAGCLGKPGQRLLVFWGRNRFGWIKLSCLYFLSRNMWPSLVLFMSSPKPWLVSVQCRFQEFHPTFSVCWISFGSSSIALKYPVFHSRRWNQEFIPEFCHKSHVISSQLSNPALCKPAEVSN